MIKPNFPQALFRGQPEKKWSFVFHEVSAEARAAFSADLAKKYAFSEDECGEVLKNIPVLFLSGLVEATAQQFIRQWTLPGVKVALTEDEAVKQKCFQIIWPEAAPSPDVALGKIKSEKYTSSLDSAPDYKNSDRGIKFLIQKLERRAAEPKTEAPKENLSGTPAITPLPNQKPIVPQVVAASSAPLEKPVSAETMQALKDELQKQLEANEKQKQIIEAQAAQLIDKQAELERLQSQKAESEKPPGEDAAAKQKLEELESESARLKQEIQKNSELSAQKESFMRKNFEELEKNLAAAEASKVDIQKEAERNLKEALEAKACAEAKLQELENEALQKQTSQASSEINESDEGLQEQEEAKTKPLPPAAPIKSLLKQALQKNSQSSPAPMKSVAIEKSQNDFKEKQAELEQALEAEKAKAAEAEKKYTQALEDFNVQKEAWQEEAKQLGLRNQVLVEKMEKEAEALRDSAQELKKRAILAEEAMRKAEQSAEETALRMKQMTEQDRTPGFEQALEAERLSHADTEKKYTAMQEELRSQEAKRQEEVKELNLRNQKLLDKFEEESNLLKTKIEELEKSLSSAEAINREAGQRLEQALEEERFKTKEAEKKNTELLETLKSSAEKTVAAEPNENASEESKHLQNKLAEIEKKLTESESVREALEADKENEIKAMREALSEVYVHLLSQMKEDNQKKDLTIQAQAAELEALHKERGKSGA
ncbi:MAG TPA: hypothetical protein PLY88_02865 [Candidatus Omnitrophota bacterium]|nr:hypothetical protein [Candidatus Omnitrophota bacterium]